jgi:hypothetical protein
VRLCNKRHLAIVGSTDCTITLFPHGGQNILSDGLSSYGGLRIKAFVNSHAAMVLAGVMVLSAVSVCCRMMMSEGVAS